jgi:hypothetical protein
MSANADVELQRDGFGDGGYQILLERNYEPSWDMVVASYV